MKTSKVTHYSEALLWIGILFLALGSRFLLLTNKPIHFDEGINGWFVMQMQSIGYYRYDPNNYHGPLYFYLLQIFEFLWSRSLETLRALPAFFSVLSVMIFSYGILRAAFVERMMALLLLLSPAFIFFGRSGIHEMPFVFFQIVTALGLLRWLRMHDSKALALLLIGLWGLLCLKETFVITLFAGGLALLSLGWGAFRDLLRPERFRLAWSPSLTGLSVILVFALVALFTGNFRNPQGLLDFFKAFVPWLKTGVHGHGHEKSFTYWIEVLWSAEPAVLLGTLLALPGAFSKHPALRVMSVFSLVQFLVYSVIPYKTVWCVLSLIWGFYFVIAFYLQQVFQQHSKWRWGLASALLLLTMLSLRSAWDSSYRQPLKLSHSYFYVNSTYELADLSDRITRVLRERPDLRGDLIQMGMNEQWPWPWLLRDAKGLAFENCGKRVLENALAYFCEPEAGPPLELLLNAPYWKISVQLRQARGPNAIYLKKSVFDMSDYKGPLQQVGPTEEEMP